ncbi:hypothetical protein VMCG_04011 [Cytospora schulzeri]|uniref:AAA+ ATPase domain-containing protein n=1 Tax=Cytospora schulzeri TaxID=448051 RepID=A0A423WU77_9PEZI|nr:hypothetical protein VMCG_04011 [Valsa malicola]
MSTLSSEIGLRCEFKTYHTAPKKDGRLQTDVITEAFGDLHFGGSDTPYALVIHRTFAEKSELKSVKLTVNSPHLLHVFREVVKSYTTVASDFTRPFELSNPFQMLVHYWDELDQYRQETRDTYIVQHLNLLFDFMEHEVGPDRNKIMAMLQSKRQITYLDAWVIFRPGCLVYTEEKCHPWLLRCQKTVYETSSTVGPYMEVHCTYTNDDGTLVGQATLTVDIYQKKTFGSEHPAFVTDLPIYPLKYAEGQNDLEKRMEERGHKFLNIKDMSVEAYDGPAQYEKRPPTSYYQPGMDSYDAVWLSYMETGRVIMDRKTCYQEHRSAQLKNVDEPEIILCPPYTFGWSLSRKCWCKFFVDKLKNVQWKPDAWDSLVMGSEQKLILQALVTSHRYPSNIRDQPEQKGKGLVILLHGTPGSGKTLTAETSAEGTEKALISASLGELNQDNIPYVFERNLKKVLQYATLWHAIVLLDEADVFLEARETSAQNSDRNALVAVFLKELEYFSGIVFLTTNRLGSFDAAMKSRIHLALGYFPPDSETRRKIWMQYLSRVPANEKAIDDTDNAFDFLSGQELNGREISNAINTACTIARFNKERLQIHHLKTVFTVRGKFDQSLRQEARQMSVGRTGDPILKRGSIVMTAEPEHI